QDRLDLALGGLDAGSRRGAERALLVAGGRARRARSLATRLDRGELLYRGGAVGGLLLRGHVGEHALRQHVLELAAHGRLERHLGRGRHLVDDLRDLGRQLAARHGGGLGAEALLHHRLDDPTRGLEAGRRRRRSGRRRGVGGNRRTV